MPDYKFTPRPEAHATTWDELMTPVSSAVRDLLVRIHGAHQSIKPKEPDNPPESSTQQTGNCFLVYGARGTGKTTVLLNAQRAICRKCSKNFFYEANSSSSDTKTKEQDRRQKIKENARKIADDLRKEGLVWLEILNLEPLPSEANLLTVLLTQVRNALHSHFDKRQSERRSIFEEEADSARQQLNALINDATLRWQNITEQDTRSISNRQVKAAEIYADFQGKFKKAMDKLAEELREVHSLENRPSIVLPIDNIDRSTEHLQAIIKLAQLVSHPNLWLVMAGDRVEVETFLERAYWKELIRSSDGAGAQGKMDSGGEDEALLMARRQANATAQKLWPANHRIEVNLVRPDETLKFINEHHSDGDKNVTIKDLFEQIKIPTTVEQRDISQDNQIGNVTLLDLFDVSDKFIEQTFVDLILVEQTVSPQIFLEHINVEQKFVKPNLTRAAHQGLLLPARSVVDLWQLLDGLVDDISSGGKDFKAEKVARTMLRTAIASSDMPNGIAQKLQYDIIRRGENGGTQLYFSKDMTSLEVIFMKSANHDFEYQLIPVIPGTVLIKSRLHSQIAINNIEDIVLSLKQGKKTKQLIQLRPLVAAWVMILHDILMLAETDVSSWVMGSPEVKWFNVSVKHTIVPHTGKSKKRHVELYWNAPDWKLFWARHIFRQSWRKFCEAHVKGFQNDQRQVAQTLVPRLLAAGWVCCVLKTTVKLISSIHPYFDFQKEYGIQELNEDVLEFEKRMMVEAADFYRLIQNNLSDQKSITDAAYEVMIATGEWLETELIYFLSYAYVPIEESKVSNERLETIWDALEEKEFTLKNHWKKNLPFILAELDVKVSAFEDENKKKSASDKKQGGSINNTDEDTESLAELLFADLYQKLKS